MGAPLTPDTPIKDFTSSPYAGITQVRFKGYLLSRSGTPENISIFKRDVCYHTLSTESREMTTEK